MQEQENDGKHLRKGLDFTWHGRSQDCAAIFNQEQTETSYGQLTTDNNSHYPGWSHFQLYQHDKGCHHQNFISHWIRKFSKICDYFPFAGQVAIQIISDTGQGKNKGGQYVAKRMIPKTQ